TKKQHSDDVEETLEHEVTPERDDIPPSGMVRRHLERGVRLPDGFQP
ncbi:12460_t:CDS:2, partial [Funneliformis mosseae]